MKIPLQLDASNVEEFSEKFLLMPESMAMASIVDSNLTLAEATELCDSSVAFRDLVYDNLVFWRAMLLRDFDMSRNVHEMRYRNEAGKQMFAESIHKHIEYCFDGTAYSVYRETLGRYKTLYHTLDCWTNGNRDLNMQRVIIDGDGNARLRHLFGEVLADKIVDINNSTRAISDLRLHYTAGMVTLEILPADYVELKDFQQVAIFTNIVDVLFEGKILHADYLEQRLYKKAGVRYTGSLSKAFYDEPGTVANTNMILGLGDTGRLLISPVPNALNYVQTRVADRFITIPISSTVVSDPYETNNVVLVTLWEKNVLKVVYKGDERQDKLITLASSKNFQHVTSASVYENYLAVVLKESSSCDSLFLLDLQTGAQVDGLENLGQPILTLAFQRHVRHSPAVFAHDVYLHVLMDGGRVRGTSAATVLSYKLDGSAGKWLMEPEIMESPCIDYPNLFVGENFISIMSIGREGELQACPRALFGVSLQNMPKDIAFRFTLARKRYYAFSGMCPS